MQLRMTYISEKQICIFANVLSNTLLYICCYATRVRLFREYFIFILMIFVFFIFIKQYRWLGYENNIFSFYMSYYTL